MPDETIQGSVNRIFHNRDGFIIASINHEGGGPRRISSVLGNMVEVLEGQRYEWTGKVEFDAKYKKHQMRFDTYRTILPDDDAGIVTYLSDHAKWVGNKIARQLVKAFGSKTLEVIRTEPDRVRELGIVAESRIDEMVNSLKNCVEYETATVELVGLTGGVIGPKTVRKAVQKWGADAGTIVKTNPFALTMLSNVGFKSADVIHRRLQLPEDDPNRHAAAIVEIMKDVSRAGHTVASRMSVDATGQKLVGGINEAGWSQALSKKDIVAIGPMVADARIRGSEQSIAHLLFGLMAEAGKSVSVDMTGLAEDQAAAARMFETSKVFILHGAPGTGKTYTLARMVQAMERAGMFVGLCAPTGKAAKQMTRALASTCGGFAVTIHSLLGPSVDEDGEFSFSYGFGEALPHTAIVVDEASMVDVSLMSSLLAALLPSTRLLIVGDNYQLPSVGPGAVLRDMLDAGVPHFELSQIKRNAGTIVKACHAVKDGRRPAPDIECSQDEGKNWLHITAGDEKSSQEVIVDLASRLLEELGFHPVNDAQMISPVNDKGGLSCEQLNSLLKGVLNPVVNPDSKLKFHLNDKVVRTKNGLAKGHYLKDDGSILISDLEDEGGVRVVNGDIGYVTAIDEETIEVRFSYPERKTWLPRSENYLQLAYCLTCHKMQGSETPVAIVPLSSDHAKIPFVNREWLYTAISRAKSLLITVGDLTAIDMMIRKVGNRQRQTMLAGDLRRLLAKTTPSRKEFDNL
jgi:exodeoxyribonuclease V alpha subunit